MLDVLASGPDFETRVAALEDNYMEVDTAFAARIAGVLEVLDLPLDYRAFAGSLALDLGARGAAALYDPQVVWPGDPVPAEAGLRALVGSCTLPPLAARLLGAADSRPGSIADGVIQALVDLCDDASGDETLLASLLAPRREVAFSPRRVAGRQAVYVVQRGDDLRSLALNLYGDPDRWEDVVLTYGLQPPYFSATERDGCLVPGQLLVSGTSRLPDAEVGSLGQTMRLSLSAGPGGSQEWDITPSQEGGIAVVGDLLCLATDCALRLGTPLGDLAEYPTYGMPEVGGLPRDSASAAQYMLAAETLKEDPRVGSVSAGAQIGGLKLLSNVVVVPVTSESVEYA